MDSSFTRLTLWVLGIAGAVTLLLYLFVFDTWVIPDDEPMFSASITPGLSPNDRILTRRGSSPVFGQLARCMRPDGSGKYTIGRVFGNSGDTVEINNENPTVSGKSVAARFGCGEATVVNPASNESVKLRCVTEDNHEFTYNILKSFEYPEGMRSARVEQGKIFLVSDNRHIHLDSRDFGQVDASTCEHVVFRLWGESFTDGSHRFNVLW